MTAKLGHPGHQSDRIGASRTGKVEDMSPTAYGLVAPLVLLGLSGFG
jgi:hypothetical protein